jgi:hypothetical protein
MRSKHYGSRFSPYQLPPSTPTHTQTTNQSVSMSQISPTVTRNSPSN